MISTISTPNITPKKPLYLSVRLGRQEEAALSELALAAFAAVAVRCGAGRCDA